MWFLVKNPEGVAQWHRIYVNRWELNVECIKHSYRASGIPIIAIARLKPKPDTDRNYDCCD